MKERDNVRTAQKKTKNSHRRSADKPTQTRYADLLSIESFFGFEYEGDRIPNVALVRPGDSSLCWNKKKVFMFSPDAWAVPAI